jgi:hypothetical protein
MPIEERDGYRLWEGGPVPKGFDGITLGRLVIVRSGRATPRLLRHEMVHVGAYRRIPMEIEADWVARRSIDTAVPELPDRTFSA